MHLAAVLLLYLKRLLDHFLAAEAKAFLTAVLRISDHFGFEVVYHLFLPAGLHVLVD